MTDRTDADVIVIGSGFGGAVAAARLAQAGSDVLVLERGRRWEPGDFPREPDLERGWLWQVGGGLYDIRWLGRMGSVQAAGWGGGSLVYANVFARPSNEALDGRWPAHLRRDVLDPYYDLAAHMLEVAPTGPDPRTGRVPERTALVEDLAERTGIGEATVRPNLAVTFGDPERWRPNRHGAARRGCAFVGECVLGCNHGAKNSLDHNYLAVAEAAGVRAVTDAQAERIEAREGGYVVRTSAPSDPDAPEREWRSAKVVLAAGAIGTTELLLRARDVHRTLPDLSGTLGHGFSGNGDFLTMADLRRRDGDMTTGPTITTTTVLDVPEGREPVWYQVQDGAVPMPLRGLIDSVVPGRRLRARWHRVRGADARGGFAVLAMGRDSSDGVLRLDEDGDAVLSWRTRWQANLHRSQIRVGPLLARMLGARMRNPPTWTLLRRTVTVHALGGVPEGDGPESGVVDGAGEVHGHPGLFVMDGSRLPAATGVNPSATILAVAERSVEAMIRRSGRPHWRAPEWDDVTPAPVPEDAAFDFMAERRAATAGDGVVFGERMRTPRPGAPAADLSLRAEIRSMERFLDDPSHPIAVRGRIDLDGVVAEADVAGTLSLFPEGRPEAMSYELVFRDADGRDWELSGVKTVRSRAPVELLRGLTTLRTRARPADAAPGEDVDAVVSIAFPELLRLGASIRGRGFTRARRLRAAARFAAFFAKSALRRRAGAPAGTG